MIKYNVIDNGFEGIFYPSANKHTACIVISGSDSGIGWSKQIAKKISLNNISSLAVAYWGTKQTSKVLSLIPIETIQSAVNHLYEQGYDKVGIYGFSKGAELALLSASLISGLRFVIAVSPPCCAMEGIQKFSFSGESSWTWQKQPIPFLPMLPNANPMKNLFRYGEFGLTEEYRWALNEHLSESNIIKVENIKGSIFLFSAQEDAQWNSNEMCSILIERLKKKNAQYPYIHEVFHPASHILCPIETIVSKGYRLERKYPEECNAMRKKAFALTCDYILNI